MRQRLMSMVLALVMAVPLAFGLSLPSLIVPAPVSADACFTWDRTLRIKDPYMRGKDVRILQIRLGGWGGYRNVVNADGVFGPETRDAVRRFKQAYGLAANGIAGRKTFRKLYDLQDRDCTPKHFAFTEFDNSATCGDQDFGANQSSHGISAREVKRNLRRVMWRLEALRRQLDRADGEIENTPLSVSSGFREHQCQLIVSDAHPSQHEFGRAADLFQGNPYSLCTMAKRARYAGFTGIIGPGSADGDHEDHVHLDIRKSGFSWDAPSCGVG